MSFESGKRESLGTAEVSWSEGDRFRGPIRVDRIVDLMDKDLEVSVSEAPPLSIVHRWLARVCSVVRLGPKIDVPLAPGTHLVTLATTMFSPKTCDRILAPAIFDMRLEHFDALVAGAQWRARFALMRGYLSFWSAVALHVSISFVSRIVTVWKLIG